MNTMFDRRWGFPTRAVHIEHARFHSGLHLAGSNTGVINSRRQQRSSRQQLSSRPQH